MPKREPLSIEERTYIYHQKLQGVPLAAIAEQLGCSYYTARKWWRRGKAEGEQGLRQSRRGRPQRGALSTYPEALRDQIKALKCSHPRWGPDRILVELGEDPQWRNERLPSRSQVALYLKEACPEHVQRQRRERFSPSGSQESLSGARDMGAGFQGSVVGGWNSRQYIGYRG